MVAAFAISTVVGTAVATTAPASAQYMWHHHNWHHRVWVRAHRDWHGHWVPGHWVYR
jgi:hypothetical protein